MTKKNDLKIGVNDRLSPGKASVLGIQHLLAMGLYMVPMILSNQLGLSMVDKTLMVQMTFIVVGITTILQNIYGIRLPLMQGPSFTPLGALVTIGLNQGLPVMFGSMIPGAIIVALLGKPLKVVARLIKKFVEPFIVGIVTIVIGLSLIPSAINEIAFYEGNMNNNFIVAIISAAIVIILMTKTKKLRTAAVVISLGLGTLISYFFGMVDISPIINSDWFSLPRLFPFGLPSFKWGPIITMSIIYMITIIESTGTWFAVRSVTGEDLTVSKLNNGATIDGVGSIISAVLGSTPIVGYSSNAGIIAISGVGSKYATIAGGIISILIGLFPKIMSLFLIIPSPVLYGVFMVVLITIFMNGIKIIQTITLNDRNMIVVGVPIILSLLPALLPKEFVLEQPEFLQYFLSSGIAMGAISAISLNVLLAKE